MGLRSFSSSWSLRHEDAIAYPSKSEIPLEKPPHQIEEDRPWKVSFFIGDSKDVNLTMKVPWPADHPVRYYHMKLYSLPTDFPGNQSEKQAMFELARESMHRSVASGFSIKRYADCCSRGLIGPGGNLISCASRIYVPRTSVPLRVGADKLAFPDKMALLAKLACFDLGFDASEDSTLLRCTTSRLLELQAEGKSNLYQIGVTTTHRWGPPKIPKLNETFTQSPSESEAGSVSQVSTETCDPVDAMLNIHKVIGDNFGDVSEESGFRSKIHSACRLAYQVADADPDFNELRKIRIHVRKDYGRVRKPYERENLQDMTLSRLEHEREKGLVGLDATSRLAESVYIAIGSNLGNRVENIESACKRMTEHGVIVTESSALYETLPMYYQDQGSFLNCVCKVKTVLQPLELLDRLKKIEDDLGREESVRNGPRKIDLDILLYDSTTFENDRLSIPHPKMMEREFVLRPLCDLMPRGRHPSHQSKFASQLKELKKNDPTTLSPLTPLMPDLPPLRSVKPTRSTSIMTVINMTPDSFSDGGVRYNENLHDIIAELKQDLDLSSGNPIIDIGGQSTRPNATQISEQEELSRILPTISAIRSDPFFANVAISVDTYRASVASAAIEAGANIVNDVSAGQMDPDMLPTIARLGCTCILMHMRGTPETMSSLTSYPNGIIRGVGDELHSRVQKAQSAGIPRWRIILDPGIGFAKSQEQSLEILRNFARLRNRRGLRGIPWVVGASRKGFIGKITGVEDADQRQFGTAAAVTAAIRGGADVVRVHDTVEMGQVAKMADAIWRVENTGLSGMDTSEDLEED